MKLEVQKDINGELFIEFPDDLMDKMGWEAGDILQWTEQLNGNWLITKKSTNTILPEDNDNEY